MFLAGGTAQKRENNSIFTKEQKPNIYSGGVIVLAPLMQAAVCFAHTFSNWITGLSIIIIGISLVFWINIKKHALIKSKKITSFTRAVIIDGLFVAAALVFIWAYLFVPKLIGSPLGNPDGPENLSRGQIVFVFPFGAIIIGAFFLIPTILTNKKIREYFAKNQ